MKNVNYNIMINLELNGNTDDEVIKEELDNQIKAVIEGLLCSNKNITEDNYTLEIESEVNINE